MSNAASQPIEWILDMSVVPGKLNDLRALMAEMVAETYASEPGALRYEFWLSADGTHCQVHEQYADDAAVATHLATFGRKFAPRFFAALTKRGAVVYGTPSDAVQRALSAMQPEYLTVAAGFSR